ncbi:tigger transposable element-derived protein 4-like, partial [Galendromus occidentalis]
MSSKAKRLCLDIKTKLEIIEEITNGVSQATVCRNRGLSKQSVNTIWKSRDKLRDASDSLVLSRKKKIRSAAYDDVEEALLKWLQCVRSQNVPVDGPLLRKKALSLAGQLGRFSFECSNGWLDRMKARHELVFRDVCGEGASVNESMVTKWSIEKLPTLLAPFAPRNVFNADETGLFYRLLPNKTICFKGDPCVGGKKSKERLTVMVAANMDGSEKLPLLVIGKSGKPRCFKHVKTLPTEYTFNRKAWMTSQVLID